MATIRTYSSDGKNIKMSKKTPAPDIDDVYTILVIDCDVVIDLLYGLFSEGNPNTVMVLDTTTIGDSIWTYIDEATVSSFTYIEEFLYKRVCDKNTLTPDHNSDCLFDHPFDHIDSLLTNMLFSTSLNLNNLECGEIGWVGKKLMVKIIRRAEWL